MGSASRAVACAAALCCSISIVAAPAGAWPWSKSWSIKTAVFDFSDDTNHNLCVCYRNGFSAGASKPPIAASDYETGYSLCRSNLTPPEDGGRAWTTGFNNAKASAWSKRSCNWYLRSLAEAE
jgi:hypothetical protein